MGYGYRREDLQALAHCKLDDAFLLLRNDRFGSAYYLAGYAVEIGLKACIAAQIQAETIPDKALLEKFFKHEFATLIGLAGLQSALKEKQQADSEFAGNWAIACEWKPESRYELTDPPAAQTMIKAIADSPSGVFPWIRTHW